MKTSVIGTLVAALLLLSTAASAGDIQIRPYVNKAGASMFVSWDTATGKSNIYYWDKATSNYVPTEVGLPAKPLAKVTGKVMIEPWVVSQGATYFIVWDTRSGVSAIYYWDQAAYKYLPTDVALPVPPVK